MPKDPAFLFYSKDWLVDTLPLSFEERGQYITLIAFMHQNGRVDHDTATRLVGKISERLESFFQVDEIGRLYSRRLEEETEKRAIHRDHQRQNAKKRWEKNTKPIPDLMPNSCDGTAVAMPLGNGNGNIVDSILESIEDNQVDCIEGGMGGDSKTSVKNPKKKKNAAPQICEVVNPFGRDFAVAWSRWKDYKRQEHKFTYKSPITEQTAINALVELSGGQEAAAIEIITQSITQGWKGLFQLKNANNGKPHNYAHGHQRGAEISTARAFETIDRVFAGPGAS